MLTFLFPPTANDLTIHSLIEIGRYLQREKLDAYIINTVHDSILLEVRPEDAQKISEYGQRTMSEIPKKYLPGLKVPFTADVELGETYGALSEAEWAEETVEDDNEDSTL